MNDVAVRVAIVSHHQHTEAKRLSVDVATWLRELGHEAWMPAGDASAIGLDEIAGGDPPESADLVLSVGGDGTMLRAVNLLGGAPVPLIGVNFGRLGYLTELEPGQVRAAIQRFQLGAEAGQWWLDSRMMLDVTVTSSGGEPVGTWQALNEAVVEKLTAGQTVHLRVHIDGEPFTSYATDGLIVSTPTGSTAYALSARGPIVSPKHRALLVTPVAPHMLFDRSLVLDPSERVDLEVLGDRPASVVVDGRPVSDLTTGEIVRCSPSAATANFVRFGTRHYHQVLKAKFGLTDR